MSDSTGATPPKRGRGRPRREGTDEEVLAATLRTLREKGYGPLTVDAIAEQTGIAKTTIYRRWPSKGALVAAAVGPMAAAPDAEPDTGSLLGDSTVLLRHVCEVVAGELGPIAAGLVGESQSSPELVEIVRNLMDPWRDRFRRVIGRAITRGQLPGDTDVELIIDLFVGPMWSRLLVHRVPIEPQLGERIAQLVVDGIAINR
jgi:AcrR family transcriptional regulator